MRIFLSIGIVLLTVSLPGMAQVSPNYDLSWSVLSDGGGLRASAANGVHDCLGQTAAGVSTSVAYRVESGFIAGDGLDKVAGLEADVAPRPGGDGTLITSDWVQVGRFVANLNVAAEGSEYQRADCAPKATSGGGSLTTADWVQAGRYVAALDAAQTQAGPTGPVKGGLEKGADEGVVSSGTVLSLSGGAVEAGGELEVSLLLDSTGVENALGFSLEFDPALFAFLDLVPGTGLPETAVIIRNLSQAPEGRVGVLIGLEMDQAFTAGRIEVARLVLSASSINTGTGQIQFSDQPVMKSMSTPEAEEVEALYISAEVSVQALSDAGEDDPGGGVVPGLPVEGEIGEGDDSSDNDHEQGCPCNGEEGEVEGESGSDTPMVGVDTEGEASGEEEDHEATGTSDNESRSSCGGCSGKGGGKSAVESLRALLADWFLIGLSLAILGIMGIRQG